MASEDKKDTASNPAFGKTGYYGDFSPEEPGARRGGRKFGGRIDVPRTKSISGIAGDVPLTDVEAFGEDGEVAVGKQVELEAGNEIQYRTCSWQKVNLGVGFVSAVELQLTTFSFRLPPFFLQSISVWLSCHSRTRTRILGWWRV